MSIASLESGSGGAVWLSPAMSQSQVRKHAREDLQSTQKDGERSLTNATRNGSGTRQVLLQRASGTGPAPVGLRFA